MIEVCYFSIVLALSVIAFLLYGFDKRRARNDGRRIPEKTLHLLALFGGWPGSLLGQRVFRHKTQKLSFRIVLWLCVAMHLAAVAVFLYLRQSSNRG